MIYNTGTAAVTANSATVTGTGTAWALGAVAGGTFFRGTVSVPILSVQSETSLTLAYPWPGTSGSGAYAISLASADAALATTILSRVNDRVAALKDISPDMRQVTGAADLAAARAAMGVPVNRLLGPGVFGRATAGEGAGARLSPDDLRSMELAFYGRYYNTASNIDTAAVGDRGLYSSAGPGTYPGAGFWWVETQATYIGSKVQIAYGYTSSGAPNGAMEYREFANDGTMGRWLPVIPRRGSNSNGEWVRFADGTQICVSPPVTFTRATVSFLSYSWTFPVGFSSAGLQVATLQKPFGLSDYVNCGIHDVGALCMSPTSGASARNFLINAGSAAGFSNTAASINNAVLGVIGRWY